MVSDDPPDAFATVVAALADALRARGLMIATAESCTGGMLGEVLTRQAGSSEFFIGGVVSYANEVKTQLLGVAFQTLLQHGAVSRACVEEMAAGARRVIGTTYGVAISGIAGPGGATPEKPVGTVHLAVAGPAGSEARRVQLPGDREQVRRGAARAALGLLQEVLQRASA